MRGEYSGMSRFVWEYGDAPLGPAHQWVGALMTSDGRAACTASVLAA